MESTTAMTVAADNTAAESAAPDISTALSGLLAGFAAMALIYITAVLMPKIAAFVDRLLGRAEKTPEKQASPEEYKVKDIYEGEKNLDDDDK